MRTLRMSMVGVTASALAALVLGSTPVGAQLITIGKCVAGKNKCVAGKVAGLLKCHVTAESKGVTPNEKDCITKVMAKYDGGPKPEKGCFTKLETKYALDSESPCATFGDSDSFEAMADAFVDAVVRAVDPAYPDVVVNKCSAGKKKCVASKVGAVLKCWQKSADKGVDPNDKGCIEKAKAKFDGGDEPAKGCFEKLEAKGDCPTQDDTAALEAMVDGFVADVVTALAGSTVTTTTAPQSTTTTHSPVTTTTSTTSTPASTTTTTTLGSGVTCGPNGVIARLVTPFDPLAIPAMAAMRLDLSYPASVSIPGSGLETDDSRLMIITGVDGTTSFFDRDDDTPPDGVDDTVRLLYALTGGRTFPPGNLADILFDCTAGVQISTSAFGCTVLDASDPVGTAIPDPQSIPCSIASLRLP